MIKPFGGDLGATVPFVPLLIQPFAHAAPSGVSLEQVDALSARRFDGSGRNRRSTTRSATCEQPQDHFWDIPLAASSSGAATSAATAFWLTR